MSSESDENKTAEAPASEASRGEALLLSVAGALLSLAVIRAAWLCDDAFITLRTVDNLVNGYGLRWNVSERVQAFTHPLWLFVESAFYAPTRSPHFAAWAPSALALVGIYLALKHAFRHAPASLAAGFAALSMSASFVEFSTSGLENALTHLAVAMLWLEATRSTHAGDPRPARLGWLVGLMMVNRLDTVLLALPILSWVLLANASRRHLQPLVVGLLVPTTCWYGFSCFYYGSPFPNTAFAKLGTAIPLRESIHQGLLYILELVLQEPWSVLVLACGFFAFRVLPIAQKLMLGGSWLYVAYVVAVGGDFMLGRFFSGPVLISALSLATVLTSLPGSARMWSAAGFLLFASVNVSWAEVTARTTWRDPISDDGAKLISPRGVADERAFYSTALTANALVRDVKPPAWDWFTEGRKARSDALARLYRDPEHAGVLAVLFDVVGMYGFAAGPLVHAVDDRGLTDPFLARLPARYAPLWRVGHYARFVPPGYLESARTGRCELQDKALCPALVRVFNVTRGPLFSWSRLLDTWRLWTQPLISRTQTDRLRYPEIKRVHVSKLATRLVPGAAWDPTFAIPSDGLQVRLDGVSHNKGWTFGLDHNDRYLIEIRRGLNVLETHRTDPDMGAGFAPFHISVGSEARTLGYDNIRVFGVGSDDVFGVAYVVADR